MMNRLSLRQLRAFHAVMISGSVTAAAKRLNLTQPAISKQLNALEDSLGLQLFHRRSGRAATPTHVGVEFFRAIEPTIVGLDEIGSIAETIAESGCYRLRIAATPPLINSAPFMTALARFAEKMPGAHVSLEPRHRLEIEDWVVARRIDLALALLPLDHPGLEAIPLVTTHAVAVVPKGHPLSGQDTMTPSDLEDVPIILPSRQPLRTRIDIAQEGSSQRLEADYEATSAITAVRLAASGLGVAICDPFSPTAFDADLAVVPWKPEIPLVYGALFSRGQNLEAAAEVLLKLIRETFAAFSESKASITGLGRA
ncbi:MAG: LysR family transcriptional regulator [Rhodobacteraceae bacterium]|nr:LysR family transcriptional regulator [Paracoccaceae bacterium]MCY4327477.1 LysR family transcriptional regulator [Paracoccaceae bacterium]